MVPMRAKRFGVGALHEPYLLNHRDAEGTEKETLWPLYLCGESTRFMVPMRAD